eukprot:6196433-Pleurochrysis_carterae.AAC.1
MIGCNSAALRCSAVAAALETCRRTAASCRPPWTWIIDMLSTALVLDYAVPVNLRALSIITRRHQSIQTEAAICAHLQLTSRWPTHKGSARARAFRGVACGGGMVRASLAWPCQASCRAAPRASFTDAAH